MEEHNNWRLERSESDDGKGKGESESKSQGTWDLSGESPSATHFAPYHGGESPSEQFAKESPPGPEVKFNGIPVPKYVKPTPVPQPAPVAVGSVTAQTHTSVTSIHIDPDWDLGDILCVLQDCGVQCERTIACLMATPDARTRIHQIRMLRDCADICHTTWCFLQRESRYSLKLCKLCAQICDACADECTVYPDIDSQRTVSACHRCAAACRAFIAAHA